MEEIQTFRYDLGKEYIFEFSDEPSRLHSGRWIVHIIYDDVHYIFWLTSVVLKNKVEQLKVHYGQVAGLKVKFCFLGPKISKRTGRKYNNYNLEVIKDDQKEEIISLA